MLETPHAVLGAAIAVKIGNPLLAIPLSLITHFVLEPLPHWNPHTYTEMKTKGKLSPSTVAIIWGDSLLALVLGLFIAQRQLPDLPRAILVIACSFFAVLPDFIEAPFYFLGSHNALIEKLIKFQRSLQFDVSPLPGIITQVITTLIFINFATH